jgi:hypothetical protein
VLNAALNDTLPAAKAKPLVISWVDEFSCQLERAIDAAGPDDVAKAALAMANDRIRELEAALRAAETAAEAAERECRSLKAELAGQRASLPSPANVVTLRPGEYSNTPHPPKQPRDPPSPWAALAEANRALSGSPYLPVDTFDANGRRLDADGLPQSRRMDRDGA